MKQYTTDMMKMLALLITTPLLVMAYTGLEKNVKDQPAIQTKTVMPNITPVAIELLKKETVAPADITVPQSEDDGFILVKSIGPTGNPASGKTEYLQSIPSGRKSALVIL
ncbi:MAG: hypothetical protein JST81_06640 [Bacteroidetes bacterium]|jgi:hypothetical protein|nr:hypothetical protein [Bacteroidota bacterium]